MCTYITTIPCVCDMMDESEQHPEGDDDYSKRLGKLLLRLFFLFYPQGRELYYITLDGRLEREITRHHSRWPPAQQREKYILLPVVHHHLSHNLTSTFPLKVLIRDEIRTKSFLELVSNFAGNVQTGADWYVPVCRPPQIVRIDNSRRTKKKEIKQITNRYECACDG